MTGPAPRAPARWPVLLAIAVSIAALAMLTWLRARLVAEERTSLANAVRVFERTDALGSPENDAVRFSQIESLARSLEESELVASLVVTKNARRGADDYQELTLYPFHLGLTDPGWREATRGWVRLPVGAEPSGWLHVRLSPRNRQAVDRVIAAFGLLLVLCLAVLVRRQQGKEAELSRTVSELEQRKAEIIRLERLALAGQLSANIFHDIKKPVLNIKHEASDALESTLAPDRQREVLRSIQLQTGLFLQMLRELGFEQFVRAEGVEGEFCGIEDMVGRALALVRYEQGDVAVETAFEGGLPLVFAPPHRLVQLFSNLVLNAFQAMEGRGVLRVSAERRGPVVEVVFHDSGPGIAPGLADSLFEPFVTSKGEGEGSGLGLYISARIASDLGGSLRLADDGSGGGGARFVVALPAPPGP